MIEYQWFCPLLVASMSRLSSIYSSNLLKYIFFRSGKSKQQRRQYWFINRTSYVLNLPQHARTLDNDDNSTQLKIYKNQS